MAAQPRRWREIFGGIRALVIWHAMTDVLGSEFTVRRFCLACNNREEHNRQGVEAARVGRAKVRASRLKARPIGQARKALRVDPRSVAHG